MLPGEIVSPGGMPVPSFPRASSLAHRRFALLLGSLRARYTPLAFAVRRVPSANLPNARGRLAKPLPFASPADPIPCSPSPSLRYESVQARTSTAVLIAAYAVCAGRPACHEFGTDSHAYPDSRFTACIAGRKPTFD